MVNEKRFIFGFMFVLERSLEVIRRWGWWGRGWFSGREGERLGKIWKCIFLIWIFGLFFVGNSI